MSAIMSGQLVTVSPSLAVRAQTRADKDYPLSCAEPDVVP